MLMALRIRRVVKERERDRPMFRYELDSTYQGAESHVRQQRDDRAGSPT